MRNGARSLMPNDMGRPFPEVWVIGTPGTRRITEFTAAALSRGAPRVNPVTWPDLIHGIHKPPPAGALVRIDSPSESAETLREILKAGILPLENEGGVPISAAEINRLACERGEMLHPRQWFLGFREVLRRLERDWSHAGLHWMSVPEAIATAFDKSTCLELWTTAGLPVPPRYPDVATYAQIRQAIPDRQARVFIKLRYGYSAMGAIALEWRGPRVRAITTMNVAWSCGRPRLFLSKRPRQLLREFEIAWLIDTLGMEKIIVEDWLSKARHAGQPYDLRVVMIRGKMHQLVGRASSSPFSNLNLDARRIPRQVVEEQWEGAWSDLELLCESAVNLIPGAGMLGLDVLLRPCQTRAVLLEANAFGDYLPGLLHRGQSTYESELAEVPSDLAGACV